jgi:hypothetical protein
MFALPIGHSRAALTAGPALGLSRDGRLTLRPLFNPFPAATHCLPWPIPALPSIPEGAAADPDPPQIRFPGFAMRARRADQNPLQTDPSPAV